MQSNFRLSSIILVLLVVFFAMQPVCGICDSDSVRVFITDRGIEQWDKPPVWSVQGVSAEKQNL